MKTPAEHAYAIRQYGTETLERIAADLAKNPLTARTSTWESGRLAAIKTELKKRRKAYL